MDISHISAGRANATSRAIGHPSSRTQETSRRRRREKMSGRRSPPGSCSFTRAVSATNISVNPLFTIDDDEFVEFIVKDLSIGNFLIALRELHSYT